jgi:L-galactose dehydrogenase
VEYRPLGRTGLTVSNLSFGASSLGGVFREIDHAEACRTVHVALDLGINFIDVAPYYGLTRAETVLGQALQGVDRGRFLLATKVGRYGDAEFDFSAPRVLRGLDESLARLGVDHVDLIQCHDIEFGELDQVIEETIPALQRAKDQGKVRFIGITGLPLAVFRRVLDQVPVDTILSYCHHCLNDSSLAELVPYLAAKGVGIINASPLSMRLLSDRGAPHWHPAPPELVERANQAAALCRERGSDLAKLAIQFAVAHPGIQTTLVGTANPDNIARNVAWVGEPIDQELLTAVLAILAPVHNVTWPSGKPENN